MLSSSFDQPALAMTLQAISIEPHGSTRRAGADATGEGRDWFGASRGKPSALGKMEREIRQSATHTAWSAIIGTKARPLRFLNSCNISHFPEASCRPPEVLHMALPQKRFSSFLSDCLVTFSRYPAITAFAGAATLMAAAAIANWHYAKKAQRDNPPRGRFIDVDGVHLHYVERGNGRPLVLFHGNDSMIQDFESSGLIDLAAENYRV